MGMRRFKHLETKLHIRWNMNSNHFKNRKDAGQRLAQLLIEMHLDQPVVLALPRGGVPVAAEVAKAMGVDFDVVIARKLGAPEYPEFGIGAISEDEVPLFSQDAQPYLLYQKRKVFEVVAAEIIELRRRVSRYRNGHKLISVKDQTVVLIDDGIATGVTSAAAAKYLRSQKPKRIIMAAPVGPLEKNPWLERYFDEVICLERPERFRSVGQWYDDFEQVEDREVSETLRRFHSERSFYGHVSA